MIGPHIVDPVTTTGVPDPRRSVPRYLARLGVEVVGRARDVALLAELQLAHLVAVPFENLDVHQRRPVRTDVAWSVPKITERRRGGWCFELNGAFGWLLRELGFRVDHVSCRVRGDEGWGPELDHCANIVHFGGDRWFVDVGFGDCCTVPIRLVAAEQAAVPRDVRCTPDGDRFVVAELDRDGTWRDQLSIDPTPREMGEFTPRSDFLRTEPGLAWTEKPFATRATDADGSRVTLRPGVLRTREGRGEFQERPVADAEWDALLGTHFGIA